MQTMCLLSLFGHAYIFAANFSIFFSSFPCIVCTVHIYINEPSEKKNNMRLCVSVASIRCLCYFLVVIHHYVSMIYHIWFGKFSEENKLSNSVIVFIAIWMFWILIPTNLLNFHQILTVFIPVSCLFSLSLSLSYRKTLI